MFFNFSIPLCHQFILENYLQPQRDLLLYENRYCLITKLHPLKKRDSHTEHVYRRCLTAFFSIDITNAT